MCYSVQPRDQIFVKGYGFLSFAENIEMENAAKNFLTKQSATDALITQPYFAVPKNIRLNSTHYFIMRIPNK